MERKKLAAAILVPAFFALGGVVHASTQAFSDGFEGTGLDSFWSVSPGAYTLAGYSLSTEQARSGSQSLKVSYGSNLSYSHSGLPALYLGHLFSTPVQGTFSVWFYDTLAPVSGGLYIDDTTTSWASLGRGYLNWSNPSDQHYLASLPDPAANVGNPSLGWHHYEITVNNTGSTYRLDGVDLVGLVSPLTQPDRLYLSSIIPNNQYNPGGYVAYFDDFSFKPVPVPAAVWLLGSGLAGLIGTRLKRKNS